MRFSPSHNPWAAPCRWMASKQYCEQLGSNRQPPPPESTCSNGETVHRYTRIRMIKQVLIRARTKIKLPPRRSGTNSPARSGGMQTLRRHNLSPHPEASRTSGDRRAKLQLSATLSAYRQKGRGSDFRRGLANTWLRLGRQKFVLASVL
jgi:hypothetical protein